jgi:hypothetical protein
MVNDAGRFLVRCRVSKGFFDGEFLVMVAGSSAYVSRDNVKLLAELNAGEVDGQVAAYLIQKSGDKALIELPGQPVVGGVRTWVPASDLAATA